jgi:hypothetical protein
MLNLHRGSIDCTNADELLEPAAPNSMGFAKPMQHLDEPKPFVRSRQMVRRTQF